MSSNKLRKALSEASISLSWATHGHLTEEDAKKCLAIVDAALNEPLKNLEVGTPEEQYARWDKYCQSIGEKCSECSLSKSISDLTAKCFARWAQMPYEKGANNE